METENNGNLKEGQRMNGNARNGATRMVHDSISPLRPNLEAIMLGKVLDAAVFKLECFVRFR